MMVRESQNVTSKFIEKLPLGRETTFQESLNFTKNFLSEFNWRLNFHLASSISPHLLPSESSTYRMNLLIKRCFKLSRNFSSIASSILLQLNLVQVLFKNHFIVEIATDMLKFSIFFIVLISHVNNSISNREKRWLIFPRGNPTRHQVEFACNWQSNKKCSAVIVYRWDRNSRQSSKGVNDNWLRLQGTV